MEKENKFFVTDLDGTLLRNNISLSKFTIETMTEALNKGKIISYSTARSYISSNALVSAIPWKYPLVLYNGALIFDPFDKKSIRWIFPATGYYQ